MKILNVFLMAVFCAFLSMGNALAQDAFDVPLNMEGNVRVDLRYPAEAKVNETITIKFAISPKYLASRAISVKVSSTKNSEADYSVTPSYPNVRATFYKPGTYALDVNTGLLVADG